MEPDPPPTSDLHFTLVGILVAAGAAWLVLTGSLVGWAWGEGPAEGRTGPVAVAVSACLAGVAAAFVGAMLGAVKKRRVRLSVVASLTAGQVAALVLALGLAAFVALGGSLADALLPATVGGAVLLGIAVTGAVMMVPRRPA